jgi:hypothetical protein
MRAMRLLPAILLIALGCSKNEETVTPPAPDSAVEDTADTAVSPWKSGPYGTKPRDVAGPFVVATTAGGWSFEERFTGEDHYLFVVYDPANPYAKGLFKTTGLQKLLAASPPNAHYFFLFKDGKADFDTFAANAQPVIPEQWVDRVQFVTTPTGELDGWLGDVFRDRDAPRLPYERYDAIHFAVDRTQHVREVGMLGRLGGSAGVTPDLSFLASEPKYYEFEHAREVRLAGDKATVVELFKDKTVVDEAFADVDLPPLGAFDTLEADLTMNCENHRDGECGAWDYLSDLRLCEGSDEAGAPKCNDEIARWITSYWREGRWVTDISGMLAMLGDGGKKKLRFWASKQWDPRPVNYIVSLSLRFSNRAKGMRPSEARKVFEGGSLNGNYNDNHPPVNLTIPAGTKKTELYALITGHGSETNQCAEFCNHTHHFVLNSGTKHSLEFPGAQSLDGCRKRVDEGVVPNQHGTWYFGRGGWCPGLDVAPFLADLSADAKVGLENTLSYQALIGTTPPAAMTSYGNIQMTTYVVFWR